MGNDVGGNCYDAHIAALRAEYFSKKPLDRFSQAFALSPFSVLEAITHPQSRVRADFSESFQRHVGDLVDTQCYRTIYTAHVLTQWMPDALLLSAIGPEGEGSFGYVWSLLQQQPDASHKGELSRDHANVFRSLSRQGKSGLLEVFWSDGRSRWLINWNSTQSSEGVCYITGSRVFLSPCR